jgi:hypothetical protein
MQSYQDDKLKARRIFVRLPLQTGKQAITPKPCAICKDYQLHITAMQTEIERLQATNDKYMRLLLLHGIDCNDHPVDALYNKPHQETLEKSATFSKRKLAPIKLNRTLNANADSYK